MVEASTVPLEEDSGDDYKQRITLSKDITNWTFYFKLWFNERNMEKDEDPEISKEWTDHDNASSGETSFELSDTETKDLKGEFFYKLTYTDQNGWDETVMKGPFHFA